ncbi:MAG TPA: glycerol-3-phosphate dehydrogenase/oxidase [Candidatus Baltobacteraceae bacterium]|nr:glycerol-3-phosphate dehydrogenase/oxidase [Candidatus Baltobacteraceae bacterium]
MLTDRAAAWDALIAGSPYDVLVIGGGVTGAAVAFEASRRGLRAALVERGDFASGTSSRSSKLVHGGLRYLKEGRIGLTRESVREREQLLRGAPGLVDPIPFVMPHYRGRKPGRATLAAGLWLYDALAGGRHHDYFDRENTLALVPPLDGANLRGAHRYRDATTDDARLVLRLIAQASAKGAVVLNYASATPQLDGDSVAGARVRDTFGERDASVVAKAVIAAGGVFADELRASVGAETRLRPLRGSHLIFAAWRFPLACAVAFEHPADGRPVFAYPWQGATLAGTTDIDHHDDLANEPSITGDELAYLLDAMRFQFPSLELEARDVVATYAGVRPVVDGSGGAPSKLSRDHVVWSERGLITITGGKLTTFRPMALDALAAAADKLPQFDRSLKPVFTVPGKYGDLAGRFAGEAAQGELERVGSTPFTWADLRWSARHEQTARLDDLLLRRTRLGLLLRDGGAKYLDRIGAICRDELRWDQARWSVEAQRYAVLWRKHYSLP